MKVITILPTACLALALGVANSVGAAKAPPLNVTRAGGFVEIDNGLVKARYSTGANGVKQEYLAARGAEWILLAEGFRPDYGAQAQAKVEVFADFEDATYGEWKAVGEAFGAEPSQGATAPDQHLRFFQGKRLANSYAKSDEPVGKLISPEFIIPQPYISFLIGGGNHPGGTCINLVVDGKTVLTQTGESTDAMRRVEWRVGDFVGQKARIEIVDNVSGGWGHIDVDQIEFSDRLRGSADSLYNSSVDPAHRFLVSETLQSIGQVTKKPDVVRVVLQGRSGETIIEQTVELRPGQPLMHIEVKAVLAGNTPRLEYLLSPLVAVIDGKPDVSHAPAFKPTADSVIGDRVFFGPVVSVQQGGRFIGLVPDLDIINQNLVYAQGARQHPNSYLFTVPVDPATVTMPTSLDLELMSDMTPRPILAYGMMDYDVHQHVWFQHLNMPGAMVRTLSTNTVRIGMDLFLSADAPKCRGYQMVAKHFWQRYGSKNFQRPKPQAMPNAEYAAVCYPSNFVYQGYDVNGSTVLNRQLPDRPDLFAWQQWEMDGQPVGGLRVYAPQWYHFMVNLGWWNNACDATGLYFWGKQLNNADWLDKARRMVNLSLSAPQKEGMFPSVYDLANKRWQPGLWGPPLHGYNPDVSSCYWDLSGGAYQSAAASVTAGYLMQYRRTCEENPRILPYVRAYGDFLLAKMQTNGCVPAWFNAELTPLPSMKWNADGGAHVWVLSELYLATGEQKYLDGAKQAAGFLLAEVMPQQRWVDFEAFYSCATKPETYLDAHTGQKACNTMSVSWALQGFLSLHEATKNKQYLDAAEAVADFASLFQAAWVPEFVTTAYAFGGFSTQLGDAEWLDQRGHRFADPFVRLGLLTGRQDLIERGIAVGRASLTLVTHPRHQANGTYIWTDFPIGLGPENIDHSGYPQRPLSSGPGWTSVGGLAGMAHVMNQLGGAYVDFKKNLAVGVDGVRVVSFQRKGDTIRLKLENQLAALPMPYDQAYSVELRIVGVPPGDYTLRINDHPPQRVDAAALARFTFHETPETSKRSER